MPFQRAYQYRCVRRLWERRVDDHRVTGRAKRDVPHPSGDLGLARRRRRAGPAGARSAHAASDRIRRPPAVHSAAVVIVRRSRRWSASPAGARWCTRTPIVSPSVGVDLDVRSLAVVGDQPLNAAPLAGGRPGREVSAPVLAPREQVQLVALGRQRDRIRVGEATLAVAVATERPARGPTREMSSGSSVVR